MVVVVVVATFVRVPTSPLVQRRVHSMNLNEQRDQGLHNWWTIRDRMSIVVADRTMATRTHSLLLPDVHNYRAQQVDHRRPNRTDDSIQLNKVALHCWSCQYVMPILPWPLAPLERASKQTKGQHVNIVKRIQLHASQCEHEPLHNGNVRW